ncbi:MAG: adenylate kinase [Acidobacteria bacterium]|nr:adenylate kinase [Acidobacteriota bacterium]
MHQPNWQALPDDEFRVRVDEATSAGGWVVCGGYHQVRESVIWPRADTVVWLDPPKRTIMRRVIWRTFRRVITREELWNGNREGFKTLLPWRGEESMVWWAWTTFESRRTTYSRAMADPRWEHLGFVHLRSPAEARAWAAGAQPSGEGL